VKLSILIPAYNERYLVAESIRRVLAAKLPEGMERELIVVDDGSRDGTREILRELAQRHPDTLRYIEHSRNMGKSAAIRTAIAAATGEFCIFQDADLEYDPNDYGRVLAPLLSGQADVVYGSRFMFAERRRVLHFRHTLRNTLLTTLSNLFTNLYLTDMETCYKAFRTNLLKSVPIRSERFGLEPEITAKVAKRRFRVYEVPINYDGRTYEEGKKITWKDGLAALWVMFKYWLIDDVYDERSGRHMLADISNAHHFSRWTGRLVRPHLGHRVLELGAGIGSISQQLQPRERYIAADCNELRLDVLRSLALRRANMEAAFIEAPVAAHFAPYKHAVDTVVCVNVLEHLPNARAALKNIHDTLAENGRLVLIVPNGRWLFCPLDEGIGNVQRYGRGATRELLASCGFVTEKAFSFNRIGTVGWLLNGKLLRRRKIGKLQLKLLDSLVWLWRRIDFLLPWPGLSLIAIARKVEPGVPPPAPAAKAAKDTPVEQASSVAK
jgi:glycosyltransferase involved in cell wall biosynthesis